MLLGVAAKFRIHEVRCISSPKIPSPIPVDMSSLHKSGCLGQPGGYEHFSHQKMKTSTLYSLLEIPKNNFHFPPTCPAPYHFPRRAANSDGKTSSHSESGGNSPRETPRKRSDASSDGVQPREAVDPKEAQPTPKQGKGFTTQSTERHYRPTIQPTN